MNRHYKARRLVATAAACLGTTAVAGLIGSAPALAANPCATNYASGSSLQNNAQKEVWLAAGGFVAHDPNCLAAPTQTYTKTSSEEGLSEFGNVTGKLEIKWDKTAEAQTALDGWVGSDDAPTAGEIGNASRATPAASPIELTIPVAQAPVAVLLSLPSGCELEPVAGKAVHVEIENATLDELWQGNKFPTWSTFLKAIEAAGGLANVKSIHEVTAGACSGAITREVRSVGSGTSYAFKSYLAQVDPTEWAQYATDYVNWPGTPSTEFNSVANHSGGELAQHVAENPGSVGYANTADAATIYKCLDTACTTGDVGFSGAATETTDGSSALHQILWTKVQNNGTAVKSGTFTPGYATPQNGSGLPKASEYTGNCATGKITPSEYGAPHSAEDSWNGVLASDPNADVDLSGNFYPICALTYDLAWKHYNETNLASFYNNTHISPNTTDEEIKETTKNYLTYVTSAAAGEGQAAIDSWFYQSLPSALQVKAAAAAADIQK
jgi:ABC-type phosphate transport system substrate-binding protein